jgi:hypothetical protein
MALWRFVYAFCVTLAGSVALVAGIASPASAQQWTEVREGNFRLEMPGRPEKSVQEVTVNGSGEVVDQIERTVTLGATEYFFSHTPYRRMPADLTPEQMLLNSRDGRPGHLLADRPLTVSGAPAREYVHEEDGWVLATRAIYAGDTLYQLIVVGRAGAQTAPATRRFFESFSLAARQAP